MNRKILLGIFIILGVGFLFYLQSKKAKSLSEEQFASTDPARKRNIVTAIPEEEPTIIRIPNAISETRKTGKYSLHISKPMPTLDNEINKRDNYLKNNQAGLVFKSSDQNFTLMKLRASKEKLNSANDKSLGHEIYPIDLLTARKVVVDDNSYPVVYKESNGRIGLLTGVILIQMHDQVEADKLALKYPIDLQIYDPSIALATYKVRDGEGLYDIFNNIRQNERVKSITVEVLDSYKGF